MKSCFVVSPIGEQGSDTRRCADQVLKHIITPAVKECGFADPVRADTLAEPGMITSQIIQRILDDDLVVADLTERNPNVFYELAIRHAIRKPLIQLIRKGETIPFDVAGMRTIQFDIQDLDSVEESKAEMVQQIASLEKPDATIESPISISIDLQNLRGSDNPEDRSLAEILSSLSDIRSEMGVMQKMLSDPTYLMPRRYLEDIILSQRRKENRQNELVNFIRKKSFPDMTDDLSDETLNSLLQWYHSRQKPDQKKNESEPPENDAAP